MSCRMLLNLLVTNGLSILIHGVISKAGMIRLSSDMICITIHAMRYDRYHDISRPIKQHIEALFL